MNKRGPMASACFIYSSGRMKKNNVRNNIKNFRNNVIVLSELCQTKFDIVPDFIRARGQKLSGTSASLLIDSCARTTILSSKVIKPSNSSLAKDMCLSSSPFLILDESFGRFLKG